MVVVYNTNIINNTNACIVMKEMKMWSMTLKTKHGTLYSWEHEKIPRKKKKRLKLDLIKSLNEEDNIDD